MCQQAFAHRHTSINRRSSHSQHQPISMTATVCNRLPCTITTGIINTIREDVSRSLCQHQAPDIKYVTCRAQVLWVNQSAVDVTLTVIHLYNHAKMKATRQRPPKRTRSIFRQASAAPTVSTVFSIIPETKGVNMIMSLVTCIHTGRIVKHTLSTALSTECLVDLLLHVQPAKCQINHDKQHAVCSGYMCRRYQG